MRKKYAKSLGILYNGEDVLVYNDNFQQIREVKDNLLHKDYYISLVNRIPIDIDSIQNATITINELLHHKFIMQDLRHRMIFTACALVAHKKGAKLENFKNLSFSLLKRQIIEVLENSYSEEKRTNEKLSIIKEQYEKITCDKDNDTLAIGSFIDNVITISRFIDSNAWNGTDVMSIFFNEFNRYLPKKPDYGQVFTPDHIVSLMYKITGMTHKDRVLDAACGSGAFLVSAMGEMISELGGRENQKAVLDICNNHLFGVEMAEAEGEGVERTQARLLGEALIDQLKGLACQLQIAGGSQVQVTIAVCGRRDIGNGGARYSRSARGGGEGAHEGR